MHDLKALTDAIADLNLPEGPLAGGHRMWAAGDEPRHRLHDSKYCGTARLQEVEVRLGDKRTGCARCAGDLVTGRALAWAKAVLALSDATCVVSDCERQAPSATPATAPHLRQRGVQAIRSLSEHAEHLRRIAANTNLPDVGYGDCVAVFDDRTEALRSRVRSAMAVADSSAERYAADAAPHLPTVLATDLTAIDVVARIRSTWPSGDRGSTLATAAVDATRGWVTSQGGGGVTTGNRLDASLPEPLPDRSGAAAHCRSLLLATGTPTDRGQYKGGWHTDPLPQDDAFAWLDREWAHRKTAAADELTGLLDDTFDRYLALEEETALVVVVGPLPLQRGGTLVTVAEQLAVDPSSRPVRRVLRLSGLGAAWLVAWGQQQSGHDRVVGLGPATRTSPDGERVEVDAAVAGLFLQLWARDGRGPLADAQEALALALATVV